MAAISIDGTPMTALPSDADQINYDNTSSGLSATEVQDAIDELALEKKDEYVTITYAQWQSLTPAQQAAKDYYISDYPSSAITAGNVSYDNSSSGMVANNVQSAVDELKSGITNLIKYVDVTITDTITLTAGTPKYLSYTASVEGTKIIGVKILSATGGSMLDGNVGAYVAANNFIHLLSTANKSFTSVTVRLFYLG